MFYATLTIHPQELTDKKMIIDQISVILLAISFSQF